MSCLTPSFQYLIAFSMTKLTQDGSVNPDIGVNPIYSGKYSLGLINTICFYTCGGVVMSILNPFTGVVTDLSF